MMIEVVLPPSYHTAIDDRPGRLTEAVAVGWLRCGFPFEKGEGFEAEGDFILSDGSVVEGAIVHCGEERIRTTFGEMDTYKLEMEPSGLTGVFTPSMYFWYTKAKPHLFVRFDGKDAGFFESRTTNVLVKYEPAKWILK